MITASNALAEVLALLDGHSGTDLPQDYLKKADEVLERLWAAGWQVRERRMHDENTKAAIEAMAAEINGPAERFP